MCESVYTTVTHSRLGTLFESLRKVTDGNRRSSFKCRERREYESCELPEIRNYAYVASLTKRHFHKLQLSSTLYTHIRTEDSRSRLVEDLFFFVEISFHAIDKYTWLRLPIVVYQLFVDWLWKSIFIIDLLSLMYIDSSVVFHIGTSRCSRTSRFNR